MDRAKQLDGKIALITGAASGIGRATALLFAQEGARVVVADIDAGNGQKTVDRIRAAGGEGMYVRADVTVAGDVEGMVGRTVEAYGRLDILMNNAGIGHRVPVHLCTEQDWDRVLDINLKGVFLGCKAAIPVMMQQGGGSIINTASGAGVSPAPRSPAYCASKAGVILLTRVIANDYAGYNIRANAICPGAVDTPLMNVAYRELSEDLAEGKRIYESRMAPRRLLTPEEVAHTALYYAVDENKHLTGNPIVRIAEGG